jgi:hypothetical protein
MSFPPGTEMFQFPGFASCAYGFSARYPCGWVAPFGDPRIKACSRLPGACRSVPRPSSPLGAKASTRCPCFPRPTPATTAPLHPAGERPALAKGEEMPPPPVRAIKQQPAKSIPMLRRRTPQTEEKAGVRPCLPAPARARRIDAQRPASMPANGLSSPLHDVKDQATVAGGTSPRQEAQGGTRFVRAGAGGEGVPLGFRGPDGPGRAPWRRGPTRSRHGTMVGLGRLERPTSRLSGVRSNQLSYRPESHPQDRAGPSTRPGPKGRARAGAGDPSVARCEGTCRRR